MATDVEKHDIRALARQGKSVNHIKDKLGIPKSTVYYHFRKEIGQKQKENRLKIPGDSEIIGEVCGIFAGDGDHYYDDKKSCHDIKIHLNQKEKYWKRVSNYFENIFDKAPIIYHAKDNRTILKYISKPLYSMLRDYLDWGSDKTESIKLKDRDYSDDFKIGFLRGLIDTDGYMRPGGRYYKFTTISKNLSNNISELLDNFKINYREYEYDDKRENHRKVYSISVTKDSVNKFRHKIEPRNPKRQPK